MATPVDHSSFEAQKTQPVPSSDKMALDSNINGSLHTPPLSASESTNDVDAPHVNGNGDSSAAEVNQTNFSANNEVDTALNSAPVENVSSGIAPTAPFLQDPDVNHSDISKADEVKLTPTEQQDPNSLLAEASGSGPESAAAVAAAPQLPETGGEDDPMLDDIFGRSPAPESVDPSATAASEQVNDPVVDAAESGVANSSDLQETTDDMVVAGPTDADVKMESFTSDAMDTSADIPHRSVEPVSTLQGDQEPPPTPAGAAAQPLGSLDQEMTDAPTGKVHARDEDEEMAEPDAKRARTGSDIAPTMEAQAEFKVPELPAQPAPSTTALPEVVQQALYTPQPVDSQPMTTAQKRFLQDLIKNIKKIKSAVPFLNPVDPITLNIPTYFDIIKHPMDVRTLEERTKTDQYSSTDAWNQDFVQMINNAIIFNGPSHAVAQSGMSLKAYVDKRIKDLPKNRNETVAAPSPAPKKLAQPKRPSAPPRETRKPSIPTPAPPPPAASPTETFALQPGGIPLIRRESTATDRPTRKIVAPKRDLPYQKPKRKKFATELKFCEHVAKQLDRTIHVAYTWPFAQPVDPVALNIPTYHKIIKKPMDFGTIKQKLNTGQYENAKEFEADFRLMFNNCYKFNPEGDTVNTAGHQFEAAFDQLWATKKDWEAEHAPEPVSRSASPDEDDEEEEEEESEEEEDDPLARLQKQIAELQKAAESIAKAKKGDRASPKVKKEKAAKSKVDTKKRKSDAGLPAKTAKKGAKKVPQVTYEQKQEISQVISELEGQKMNQAIQIIRNGCEKYKNMDDDELELDIDELPEDVIYELWKFVRKNKPQRSTDRGAVVDDDDDFQPKEEKRATAAAKPKKHKPMSKYEQESQIAQMRRQLSQFQSGTQSSPEPAQTAAAEEESSGDEESASESEEE